MNRLNLRLIAGVACAALLLIFATLCYTAALTKSPTYDEPLHAVAGFAHRTLNDWRMNPEDPALFGLWGSLPHADNSFKINKDYVYWDAMIGDFSSNQWPFAWLSLYQTPGNNGDEFIQRSRFMFVLVGIALGAVIATFAWQLAGPIAAMIAAALFCFDPNFLAHSGLVKNDVMLSLMFACLAISLWRFGRRGTWLSLAGIALSTAAAVNVKYSGILAAPIILLCLVSRALLPAEWMVCGLNFQTRLRRLIPIAAVVVLTATVSYTAIWACYGFRYLPTNDPKVSLDVPNLLLTARRNQMKSKLTPDMRLTQSDYEMRIAAETDHAPARMIQTLMDHRFLPQAWLYGFFYTYATTLVRSSYLLGKASNTGWWYYFPCTFLFKTPTATLAAIPLTLAGLFLMRLKRRANQSDPVSDPDPCPSPLRHWPIYCLAIPVAIYMASAMSTNLNLGLRHILPVYPFLFVALAVALTRVINWDWKIGGTVAGLIVLGLAAESTIARPNYIAFFNAPSGGSAGGFKLLGDSNLDWGQDLKLLGAWQKQHMDRPLFLAYFGIADPSAYGVVATYLPYVDGGWPFAAQQNQGAPPFNAACYFAISATSLQGIYVLDDRAQVVYRELQKHEPAAVLGGTIYIYELPLAPSAMPAAR